MASDQKDISSLIVPMQGMGLLVPHSMVAEIVPFGGMEAKTKGPDWLLGDVVWRGQKLPLMSFEAANGEGMVLPRPGSRFAVMNAITGQSGGRSFYAILVHGNPSTVRLTAEDLHTAEGPEANAVKHYVRYHDSILRIPDPDALEPLLNALD